MKNVSVNILMFGIIVIAVSQTALSQWTQLNGPECATVKDLAQSGNKIFAACNDHLYITTNKGISWEKDKYSFTGGGFLSVIAKEELIFAGSSHGVLYRSSDAGASWQPVNQMIYRPKIRKLQWHADTLYAGTEVGLYVSTDLGTEWKSLTNSLPDSNIRSFFVEDSFMVAGISNKGIYRSTNSGKLWSTFNSGIEHRTVSSILKIDSLIYAGTDSGLYRISLYSNVWSNVHPQLSSTSINTITRFNNTLIIGATDGIIISDVTLTQWHYSIRTKLFTNAYCFLKNSDTIFCGFNSRGVYYSSDQGETWKPTGTINKYSTAYSIAVQDSLMLVGHRNGIGFSRDEGATWIDLSTDSVTTSYQSGIWDSTLYVVTDGGLFSKKGFQSNWIRMPTNSTVNKFAKKDNVLFVTTANGLFRSSDFGRTFLILDSATLGKQAKIVSVFDSTVFVQTEKGIFRSSNLGTTWKKTGSNILENVIQTFTRVDSFYFCANGGSIYRMSVNDSIWEKKLNDDVFDAIYELQPFKNALFVTSIFGLFYSTDYGNTWSDAHFQFYPPPTTFYSAFTLGLNKRKIFAGDYSIGIWWNSLDNIITRTAGYETIEAKHFSLSQNYPNPFNPSTRIEYHLPIQEFVTLKIFDLLGRETITLVNEVKSAGSYSVQWNASQFASGIYFARLQSGTNVQTRKLLLLK